MEYRKALIIAQDVFTQLAPYCERIVIAGSIRRQKAQVKDIEIVCIPKLEPEEAPDDLFSATGTGTTVLSAPLVACKGFIRAINQWQKVKGEPIGKYTQRILPEGIKLDVFMAAEDNFGYILMLRTGSSEWNQRVMLFRLKGNGYKMSEGHIHWKGAIVPIRDEAEMFSRMGVYYVEPQNRK